jgi:hypothetical protein
MDETSSGVKSLAANGLQAHVSKRDVGHPALVD